RVFRWRARSSVSSERRKRETWPKEKKANALERFSEAKTPRNRHRNTHRQVRNVLGTAFRARLRNDRRQRPKAGAAELDRRRGGNRCQDRGRAATEQVGRASCRA